MSDFKSLNLLPSILIALENKGYQKPTPVQAQTIPHLLAGRDLLGISQTGTGKTASFSLPMITMLAETKKELGECQTRALILAPTRELATQIYNNICAYSMGTELSCAVVIGGVRKEPQIENILGGIDIVVATPGRLMDLMSGGHIRFEMLEFFVLDEADMMLDMGFYDDVQVISKKLPSPRQTILFSATMPKEIEELANTILDNPVKIESAPESSTISKIDQLVYFVEENDKISLLSLLLQDEKIERVLIFCKAKYGIANVVDALNACSISNGEIHSNRSQAQRDQAISDFSKGEIRVLVATDIASRGIDISGVTHVINFNLPEDPTYYVHRIGRTARAGRSGNAISLCGERDLSLLRSIQKIIKINIPIILEQPFHKEFPPRKTNNKRDRNRKRPSQAKRAAKKKFLDHL